MAKGDREHITLACDVCSDRNYTTMKSKRNDPDRISLRKYCPKCRQHVVHQQTR